MPQNENKETSFAILFINRSWRNKEYKTELIELGLNSKKGYLLQSVFDNEDYGVIMPNNTLIVPIPKMDVVLMKCKVN